MTMHDEWTDKLSDYLDDELQDGERAAVEAHLRACRECTAVLHDLQRVVARAQGAAAVTRPPLTDLWPGVAGRIERIRQPHRLAFTIGQLAAAAALVAIVSGAVAIRLLGPAAAQRTGQVAAVAPSDAPLPAAAAAADDAPRAAQISLADDQYDAAVADLEKALKAGRGRLDQSTIDVVEHNLQIIDQAIAQARDALAADPANAYLSGHLVEARRRKLDLLRRAAALADTD